MACNSNTNQRNIEDHEASTGCPASCCIAIYIVDTGPNTGYDGVCGHILALIVIGSGRSLSDSGAHQAKRFFVCTSRYIPRSAYGR